MLAIFAFKGGNAFFANRYVRTEGEGSRRLWRQEGIGGRAVMACMLCPLGRR